MGRKYLNFGGAGVAPTLSEFLFQKILEGRGYTVGTGILTSTVLGNFFKIYAANPTGSGKHIFLYRIRGLGDKAAAAFASVRVSPTGGIPTSALRPPGNMILGGTEIASVLEFRADVSDADFTGGGLSTNVLAIPPATRWDLEFFPLILRPGRALAFSLASGGINHDLSVSFYFVEDDA